MRFTLDTNILVYAIDRAAGERHDKALEIIGQCRGRDVVLTLQSLGEFFRAATVRHRVPARHAMEVVQEWRDAFSVVAADGVCLVDAMDAVAAHSFSFWDAMLWATAKRHGCRLVISEDGQNGRTLGGVTIADPFVADPEPLLREAFA
ncbi:PIN domain-containing protein [Azospirillum rugosum]|uniref:Ribonuclease VapC n=1 Tax=Azospirillum rugosum TaxID=416170 RepID=A0ABS4SRH3_9PROT|nr:PIN domain-containing protein [Azospirillum rugosum]MBP2295172.1 putative nucleic acid-binding protein [Azospirillum rugosum]MDQ0528546.1 putative nucleic acid-binding protein [Azospirillum rugosum]